MGEVVRRRGKASFRARYQTTFYRHRPADPGTVDGKRIHGIGGDRLANQLPDLAQRSVIQRHTGTAQGDIHSTIRRINMAFTMLSHGSPGVKQNCGNQDTIVKFIHFLSHLTMYDYAPELGKCRWQRRFAPISQI
jgi:hypothetical protein